MRLDELMRVGSRVLSSPPVSLALLAPSPPRTLPSQWPSNPALSLLIVKALAQASSVCQRDLRSHPDLVSPPPSTLVCFSRSSADLSTPSSDHIATLSRPAAGPASAHAPSPWALCSANGDDTDIASQTALRRRAAIFNRCCKDFCNMQCLTV